MQALISIHKRRAVSGILAIVLSLAVPGPATAEAPHGGQPEPEGDSVPVEHRVRGEVIGETGRPISGALMRAYDRSIGAESFLGESRSDEQGQYTVLYDPAQLQDAGGLPQTLVVRAFSIGGLTLVAESDLMFHAVPDVVVNLTVSDHAWAESLERDRRDSADRIRELAGLVQQGEMSFQEYIEAVEPDAERIARIEHQRLEIAVERPGDEKPDERPARRAEDPAQALLQRYQDAARRLVVAMQPLGTLMREGHISPEALGELMEQHQGRLNKAQAELEPQLAKLAQHMQQQLMARLGQQQEPVLSDQELADIGRAVENAATELDSLANTLERATAGFRQVPGDDQD